MNKAIITGATSALSRYLIAELLNRDIMVFAIIRRNSARKFDLEKQFAAETRQKKLVICEINLDEMDSDYAFTTLLNAGADDVKVFYHFAWEGVQTKYANVIILQERNIKHTLDAIELFSKLQNSYQNIAKPNSLARLPVDNVSNNNNSEPNLKGLADNSEANPRFIYAGSRAEFGRGVRDENPQDAYGIAKLSAARLGKILAKQKNVDFIHTRIFTTYGTNNRTSGLLNYIIPELITGKDLELTKCEQNWDWLHFSDAARAFTDLGNTENIKVSSESIYEIGSGEARPLREWVEVIRDMINPSAKIDFGAKPYFEGQLGLDFCANTETLQEATSFKPSIAFEDGIKEVIENYKSLD